MTYKVGDWVLIISNEYSNIRSEGYDIGSVFQVAEIVESGTTAWLRPTKRGWGILSTGVVYAKNKIVTDILMDL